MSKSIEKQVLDKIKRNQEERFSLWTVYQNSKCKIRK